MGGANIFGYVLVGLCGALLAQHWHQWRDWRRMAAGGRREFVRRQLQRRIVASALIGVVGAAMTLADRVPHTALAMSTYLFALVMAGGVILSIALADLRATRRLRDEEQLNLVAEALRKVSAESN